MKFDKKSSFGGLIIKRREGERIFVNHGELVVEVVQIIGKTVCLAFKADKEIAIRREEPTPTPDPRQMDLPLK